ncbi:aspartyl protease family protein At5g10770-like [Typha angustifolia]|uniref:aspartyl protease family protein At5g10770-like n=1 Tax=Typha angustifolia TaxID=59011 RepID=UPI003C2C6D6A
MVGATTPLSSPSHSMLRHLLLIPLLLAVVAADGGFRRLEEKKVVTLHQLQWGEKGPSLINSPQISRRKTHATVLEMKQHSQLPRRSANAEDYPQMLLVSDEARASSIQSRIKHFVRHKIHPDASEIRVPLNSGVSLQTLNYVTTVAVGGKSMTVIVDTGSDLTWVQCKPCFYCYNQQDPIFEPSASSSYQSIPCNSSTCNAMLQAATGSSGVCGMDRSSCYYALSYGDGSYTRGVLAKERLTLGEANVEQFVFGCGRSNRGLFGGTSGLMGLGRTQLSLISQTSDRFGGVFSYCLPTRLYNSSGSLVLGSDTSAYKNSSPIAYTRMIADPEQPPFYFLNLTGASVGGLGVEAPGFGNGKILIDSGTVITRLPPSVYKVIKEEFVRQFVGYPSAPAFSILDTCFNLSSYEEVKVPTLRLRFEGDVEMSVDATGIFYFAKKDASQVCLAIASLSYEDQAGIIGNYQQKNQRVVYDTFGSRLGFAEEACNYS